MLSKVSLAEALKVIGGKAFVYLGDPLVAAGLTPIGATEGDITVEENFTTNDLKAPEYTGDVVHQRDIIGQNVKVTIPLIPGSEDVYAMLSALGTNGGGFSEPQPVVEQSLVIIPKTEVASGISRATGGPWVGGAYAPAGPKHAVWIWRAVRDGALTWAFGQTEKGRRMLTVSFIGLFDDTKPEGDKVWSRGDPATLTPAVNVII